MLRQSSACLVAAGCLIALLLCSSTGFASAASDNFSYGRHLLLTTCPATCQSCVSSGTGSGVTCSKCYGNLVILKSSNPAINGNCGCPAGTYATGSRKAVACSDCPVGSWCPGGLFSDARANRCPTGMTTVGKKASQITSCGE